MELPAASQAASEGSTPPGECLLLAHNDRTGGDVISMGQIAYTQFSMLREPQSAHVKTVAVRP